MKTHEIIIKDRAALAPCQWGLIFVDEGHRLKNLDCQLMRDIFKYQGAEHYRRCKESIHSLCEN